MTSFKTQKFVRVGILLGCSSVLAFAPISLSRLPDLSGNPVMAQGNSNSGNSNSGGNSGNSNAGGNSGNHGASNNASGQGSSSSAGRGNANAPAGSGAIASALGALNAAHASPSAMANAAPNSQVGKMAAYDRAMIAAINMPSQTPAQIAARTQAISNARSTQLAAASNKALSSAVVARVDELLGLPSTDPTLGVP